MEPFLYSFFHKKTNDRSEDGLVQIPKDPASWPESWRTFEYKKYPRLEKVALSTQYSESGLYELLEKRTSEIVCIQEQAVSLDDVATLLGSGYGNMQRGTEMHKTVPSGGARFPLELYVSIWGQVDGIAPGNYHYSATEHNLSILPVPSVKSERVSDFTNDSWVSAAHGVILLSAVFDRTVRKYGSRGYRYTLLEAGHVGQNIALAAAERNVSVRPLGAITETYFEQLLQLDVTTERIVYAIVF